MYSDGFIKKDLTIREIYRYGKENLMGCLFRVLPPYEHKVT